jgi:hypothetical protein
MDHSRSITTPEYTEGNAMIESSLDKISDNNNLMGQYQSVEFLIKELEVPYQVRIWENESESMNILVKESSSILPFLKVGDTLDTKFYSKGSTYPSEKMKAIVRHITKKREGRLKGHYLIGLKIVEG